MAGRDDFLATVRKAEAYGFEVISSADHIGDRLAVFPMLMSAAEKSELRIWRESFRSAVRALIRAFLGMGSTLIAYQIAMSFDTRSRRLSHMTLDSGGDCQVPIGLLASQLRDAPMS